MIFKLLMPIDIPIVIPVNVAPLIGQMGMEQLHVLGALLVAAFVIASAVIGWKTLHASKRRTVEQHAGIDRRDLDQAA